MTKELSYFLKLIKKYLVFSFISEKFLLALTYLEDIDEILDNSHRLSQGKNAIRINDHNAVLAFITKLRRWYQRVQKEYASLFLNIDVALKKN